MFLLLITSFATFVHATENVEPLTEKSDYMVDTKARVMETYGVKEIVTGTVLLDVSNVDKPPLNATLPSV